MPCPSNPTPINRQDIKSGTAVFLEEGMIGRAVSTGLISPTPFPAGSGTGKRWQVFSHSAIQPSPYLHPGSATSRSVLREAIIFSKIFNLLHFLWRFQNGVARNLPTPESIPNQCNLSLIGVIKDFSIPEKSCIFSLTSKSVLGIISN
jgi:hypothetical protein